jgi:O-antigen/teichoic acid export membrane protein
VITTRHNSWAHWLSTGPVTRQILSNAGSLFGTTMVTSLLGFVFWAVAARLESPSAVGEASAYISAMQLLGTFGTLGLGTLLIAEVGRLGDCRKSTIMTCLWIAAVVSGLAGIAYCCLVDHLFLFGFAVYKTSWGVALFSCATALTAATMVLDGGLIGLLKSKTQLWRNSISSAVKLLLIPLGLVTSIGAATDLFLWWFIGLLASVAYVVLVTERPITWLRIPPSRAALQGLGLLAVGHHWLNVASQIPRLLLPILVSVQLSSATNAAFYVALLLAGIVWIVPNHIATAMFAIDAHDASTLQSELARMWRLCRLYAVTASIAVTAVAQPLLAIFGSTYAQARWALVSFAAVTFAAAIKSLYIAVRRAQRKLRRAVVATCLGTVLELSLAELGLTVSGTVTGVALGVAIAMLCETFGYWPAVRAAMATSDVAQRSRSQHQVQD